MDLQGIIRAELAAHAEWVGREALDIVETGTIRGADEQQYRTGDGWSTIAFAEHVRDHGGTFTSIDLDVSTAREVLAAAHLDQHVRLIEDHSIRALARLAALSRRVDVALLDSDNDAQLILHEYLVVSSMMHRPANSQPALLLVDDVDLDSALVVKGHQLVPWLNAAGVPYKIVQRDAGGYTTGVLIARLAQAA
jgi:hypothetical protein